MNNYITPSILKTISIEMESGILLGSIVDNATVETTGQEVVNYDFNNTELFNHKWE